MTLRLAKLTKIFTIKIDLTRSCKSKPVLVQPVEGTNLLYVLDPDKNGRCVASSKLVRSDPNCEVEVKPLSINKGGCSSYFGISN